MYVADCNAGVSLFPGIFETRDHRGGLCVVLLIAGRTLSAYKNNFSVSVLLMAKFGGR